MFDVKKNFTGKELHLIRSYPDTGLDTSSVHFEKNLEEYNSLISKGILYNQYPDRFNKRAYTLCVMTYAGSLLQALVVQQHEHKKQLEECQRICYDEVYEKGYNEAIQKMGCAMAEMIASHIGQPSCK